MRAQRNPNFANKLNALPLSSPFQGSHRLSRNCQLPWVPWELSLLSSIIIKEVHLLQGGCLRCTDGCNAVDTSRHHFHCISIWIQMNAIYFWRYCAPVPALVWLHLLQGRLSGTASPVWFVFPSWSCPYSCLYWQGKNVTWPNASPVPKGNDSISTLHFIHIKCPHLVSEVFQITELAIQFITDIINPESIESQLVSSHKMWWFLSQALDSWDLACFGMPEWLCSISH